MSFKFKKVVTTEFEVDAIIWNFMNYQDFCSVRKDKDACGLCQKKFSEDTEFIHLAMLRKHHNRLFCRGCAEDAIAGGAERVDKR